MKVSRSNVTPVCCTTEALERRVMLSKVIAVGAEFQVNTYTTSDQRLPSSAMDADGDFVVTWESSSQDGSGSSIFAQRYDAQGVPRGAEFRVNTYTTGHQRSPSVAMDADGDFIIAWTGPGQGQGYGSGIFAQRYNAAGIPQQAEFRVNTVTTASHGLSSVAMDAEGNFVVVWAGSGALGRGVYGRLYSSDSDPDSEEFYVAPITTIHRVSPSVAMSATGDFVVAAEVYGLDGSSQGIFARRYDSAAVAQGELFQVNTFTTNTQVFPSVAVDSVGNFVITWRSHAHPMDGVLSIYARRYHANGEPLGGEFRINTTLGFQERPAIAMDRDGDFIVAWEGYPQDGSGYGVSAQRYNSSGVAQGGEISVNTYTADDQDRATIAMDAAGNFVVAWQSALQDGSGSGIFAQRYAIVPEVTSSAFLFDSSPHRLRYRFNHDVRESLGTDDLLVQNLTTGQVVPANDFALLYDPASNVATFIYVGGGSEAIAGVLPDGRYRATLLASGIVTPQGASPAADHEFDFFFLNGDANRDGRVNLSDFNILVRNFGQSGTDFTRGDFTFDGVTDLEDFNLFVTRFGVALPGVAGRNLLFSSQETGEDEQMSELLR